jgi:hypothetical protein
MGVIRRTQTLYRDNIGSFKINDLFEAGTNRFTVNNDRTGTTLALPIARLLGPGEIQVITQEVEKNLIRLGHDFSLDAIYC